jgi:hypothetical protein
MIGILKNVHVDLQGAPHSPFRPIVSQTVRPRAKLIEKLAVHLHPCNGEGVVFAADQSLEI